LPFGDNECDAVYHSHVLEHLRPEEAARLLAECFRVLKPGGTLRIAVPDLEGIARHYLHTLETAANDPAASADHEWMTVELLDQMVRTRSGGQMRHYFENEHLPNRPFIRSRIGSDSMAWMMSRARDHRHADRGRSLTAGARRTAAATLAWALQPRLKEVLFRRSGEVTVDVRPRFAQGAARIARLRVPLFARRKPHSDFATYSWTHRRRSPQPDSLFVEATKPSRLPQLGNGVLR
jgi:predicted SAM-dependent methyltransferase